MNKLINKKLACCPPVLDDYPQKEKHPKRSCIPPCSRTQSLCSYLLLKFFYNKIGLILINTVNNDIRVRGLGNEGGKKGFYLSEMLCYRKILLLSWKDHKTNKRVLKKTQANWTKFRTISLTLEASRWGMNSPPPPPSIFFGLKSERHDQLPKALAKLFLNNEYMFWHQINDVIIDDVIAGSHESWIFI